MKPPLLPVTALCLLLLGGPALCQSSTNSPVVMISDPANGDTFEPPSAISLIAPAGSPSGYVTAVQFFANGLSIGVSSNFAVVDPPGPGPYPYQRAFFLSWSNVTAGGYALVAVAVASSGMTGTSAPVNIVVTSNRFLPSVTIFAPDPVASVGSNCPCAPTPPSAAITNSWPGWTNFADLTSANFVIARDFTTNTPLTVVYSMLGTATNGLQYAALTGSATIPAGRRTVQVPIIPLESGAASMQPAFKTVVLELQSSPFTPSTYDVGVPSQAVAVIVQNNSCPQTGIMANGVFHFELPGTNGFWYRIDASGDLLDWVTICTNIVDHGALHFLDSPPAPGAPARYYRVTPVNVPATWPE